MPAKLCDRPECAKAGVEADHQLCLILRNGDPDGGYDRIWTGFACQKCLDGSIKFLKLKASKDHLILVHPLKGKHARREVDGNNSPDVPAGAGDHATGPAA